MSERHGTPEGQGRRDLLNAWFGPGWGCSGVSGDPRSAWCAARRHLRSSTRRSAPDPLSGLSGRLIWRDRRVAFASSRPPDVTGSLAALVMIVGVATCPRRRSEGDDHHDRRLHVHVGADYGAGRHQGDLAQQRHTAHGSRCAPLDTGDRYTLCSGGDLPLFLRAAPAHDMHGRRAMIRPELGTDRSSARSRAATGL
jgi:hypothetical protein